MIIASCESPEGPDSFKVMGYKPVYLDNAQVHEIMLLDPIILQRPGKIYLKQPFIYIGEKGKGVHVIYNGDPAHPVKRSFISIPGNRDIAIKGNIMYADNVTDLLAIDISNPDSVRVVKRIENVYPSYNQEFPECYDCWFECVDTTMGFVTDWIETELDNPKCER